MNNNKHIGTNICKHIYGTVTRKDSTCFLTSNLTQINGNEDIKTFERCPICGKLLGYRILLTQEGYIRHLERMNPSAEQIEAMYERKNKILKKRKKVI